MARKFTPIKNRYDGFKRAKKYHFCLDCRYSQHEKYNECPKCGSKNRQYFMSEREMKRGALLLTLQAAGTIEKLRFQPRYELKVNGRKICVYTADAEYYKDGQLVVEDTKPKDWMDDLAKFKIKLFEALFNVIVTIPQRDSGNRT